MLPSGGHEFVCKRCKKPLEVDPTIIDNLKNIKDLDATIDTYFAPAHAKTKSLGKVQHHSDNNIDFVPDADFEVILPSGESNFTPTSEPPHRRTHGGRRLRTNMSNGSVLSKVFDIYQHASDQTGVDHPLCAECTEKILGELEEQLKDQQAENAAYANYIKQLEEEESAFQNMDELEKEISELEGDEEALRKQLLSMEEERKRLKREKEELERDSEKLQNIEKLYWQNYTELQGKLAAFQEEKEAVRVATERAGEQLEVLKKTNLYNDAFHIWHDGHFGTINGFRLGDLPSRQVPWDEINAAWGQAVLLLYTIAKKLNFKFSTYRLVPMGSNSKIIKIDDQSTYELFGTNDYAITKILWYSRYDKAMLGFLQCLKELADHAESEDKHFRLPYRMDRDKIGEMSIKYSISNIETWTKALKYMLTNLKWLLAWMARRQS
jgi:beclin 1